MMHCSEAVREYWNGIGILLETARWWSCRSTQSMMIQKNMSQHRPRGWLAWSMMLWNLVPAASSRLMLSSLCWRTCKQNRRVSLHLQSCHLCQWLEWVLSQRRRHRHLQQSHGPVALDHSKVEGIARDSASTSDMHRMDPAAAVLSTDASTRTGDHMADRTVTSIPVNFHRTTDSRQWWTCWDKSSTLTNSEDRTFSAQPSLTLVDGCLGNDSSFLTCKRRSSFVNCNLQVSE